MCGICGILISDSARQVERARIIAMRDALHHRGPDDQGLFVSGNVGLGHTRLSIIDLSPQGRQPFASTDGRYQIVFNGEIYNYRELRESLSREGHVFRTKTDTEVLLALYMQRGTQMLDALNGMFAFAVWDEVEQTLFLARDRLGVKPLYYARTSDGFAFASEPKALFAGGLEPEIDDHCLDELLMFRFIAGERTIFRNVLRLLPGHAMMLANGSTRTWRWWNLGEKAAAAEAPRDPVRWYGEMFDDSVRYRLISDVPVGILLSGGIDSTSVAASSSLQGHTDVGTFTVAFDEKGYDEAPLAKTVADSYNLSYYELTLRGEDLYTALQDSSWYLDEPVAHQNDPQLLAISQLAKQHVSVLLSGEGSDEILGGYVRYRPLKYLRSVQAMQWTLGLLPMLGVSRERAQKLRRYIRAGDAEHLILYNTCNFFPDDLRRMGISLSEAHFDQRRLYQEEARKLYPESPFRRSMYVDQHVYLCSLLDRNDRTTMGASIECREPFLDHRVVETLASLPDKYFARGRKGKYLLVHSLGYRLPSAVQHFKKWGFAVPWERYFREQPHFRTDIENMHRNPVFERGILGRIDVKDLTTKFLAGDNTNYLLLRQLYMIDIWQRTYFSRLKKLVPHQVSVEG